MAKFCGKCGALVENGVCPKCGAEYQGTAPFVLYKCREKARNKIKIHIIINCILWICIGALQLLIFITFEECSILKYLNIFSISTHLVRGT